MGVPNARACSQTQVSAIVRLNNKEYDRADFIKSGFNHYDLYFEDCTTPDEKIVKVCCFICAASVLPNKGRWCACQSRARTSCTGTHMCIIGVVTGVRA